MDWKDLWYDADYHNGELTIPKVPEEPGNYSVSVYFNGDFSPFTVTEAVAKETGSDVFASVR